MEHSWSYVSVIELDPFHEDRDIFDKLEDDLIAEEQLRESKTKYLITGI